MQRAAGATHAAVQSCRNSFMLALLLRRCYLLLHGALCKMFTVNGLHHLGHSELFLANKISSIQYTVPCWKPIVTPKYAAGANFYAVRQKTAAVAD